MSTINPNWKKSYENWFFDCAPQFPTPKEQANHIEEFIVNTLQKRINELEGGIKKAMEIRSQPYGSGDYEILKELLEKEHPIDCDCAICAGLNH